MPIIPNHLIDSLSPEELRRRFTVQDVKATLNLAQQQTQPSQTQPELPGRETGSIFETTQRDPSQDFFSKENLSTLAGNIIPSAVNVGRDVFNTITSPIETAEKLGELGVSGIAEGLKERFGGIENLKRTATEDPFGLLLDVAPIAGAAGRFARGAGPISRLGRGVAAAGKVAGALDPIAIAGTGVKGVGKIAGGLSKELLSVTTGLPARTIGTAAEEFVGGTRKSRKVIRKVLRGKQPIEDVPRLVQEVVFEVGKQNKQAFKNNIAAVNLDTPVPIELFTDMKNKVFSILENFDVKTVEGDFRKLDFKDAAGLRVAPPSARRKIQEIFNIIQPPATIQELTLEFVDKAKRDIDQVLETVKNSTQSAALGGQIRSQVRELAGKVGGENYNRAMFDYEQGAAFSRELTQALSAKFEGNAETMINKLAAITTSRSEFAQKTVKRAEEATGVPLTALSVGLQLEDVGARGLVGRSKLSSLFFAGGAIVDKALFLALPLTSPRAVGEALNAIGITARPTQPFIRVIEILNANPITRELGAQGLSVGAIINQIFRETGLTKEGPISGLERGR